MLGGGHSKGVRASAASWILQDPSSRGQARGELSIQWSEVPLGLGGDAGGGQESLQ